MEKRYLNTKEQSEYLGRSEKPIRRLAFRKAIPHYKPGERLLFNLEEIEKWIKAHEMVLLEELEHSVK